jgi:hypothetical protein
MIVQYVLLAPSVHSHLLVPLNVLQEHTRLELREPLVVLIVQQDHIVQIHRKLYIRNLYIDTLFHYPEF